MVGDIIREFDTALGHCKIKEIEDKNNCLMEVYDGQDKAYITVPKVRAEVM